MPEFDGRLITVPFSFKEFDPDGLSVYVADPERAARVAGIAVRARPAAAHPDRGQADRADAVSAYPTKHARIGNAVGLDTPAQRGRAAPARWPTAGYDVGDADRSPASPSRTATR